MTRNSLTFFAVSSLVIT